MFPPLSHFNANHNHQQHQHLSHINIPTTTATTAHAAAAAASLPVVPAKRKRASTSIAAQAHQLQQQQQHQHQHQQYTHNDHLQQPAHPTLPPRSYSAYSHIQQHQQASTTPVVQQTPGSHSSIHPSSTTHLAQATTTILLKNVNGNDNSAPGGSAAGSAIEDIHCICGYTDDDGYTIACDDCQRWSHMVCFNISVGKDPPEWRCWECAPRPVNRERARDRQAARVAAQQMGRLGPFLGTPEAEALAARQRKRRDRKPGAPSAGISAPPLSATHSGGADGTGEDEHIDIEDDWRTSYFPLKEDLIPQASTRAKLRGVAQNWRGITALMPDESEDSDQRTKVVPIQNAKDDAVSTVRPPGYSLQTTGPIANDGLIAPFTSTIIPSAQYFADPLNGYAQMGLPKPHVHLVPPPLSVALDARMAGNEARFIRSGCRPNAVLRPVLCPSKHDSDDNEALGAVKFAVFALRDLKASEEVVLGWEWDDGAVVHQLPALIEEGMRSGAGPSKMTPHHIERLRLQMQCIVESLKSSFVTCACGSAASDCAVRLMEMFADGGIHWLNGFNEMRNRSPKVSRQTGNSRPSSSQAQPNQTSTSTHFHNPTQSSRISPSTNRHGSSLNDVQDHGRYMNAKMRAKLLGPLVGAERGVRTRLVGGPDSGGLMGVQQVSGDRWDRFGELDDSQDARGGSAAPEVRVERPSPSQRKGKGVVRGPNGIGLGIGFDAQSPSGIGAHQASSLRSSLAPDVGSPSNRSEALPGEIAEEKMPPRMRKKWIQKRLEILRSEYPPESETSEGNMGLGLSLNRRTPLPPNGMEVDNQGRSGSETDNPRSVSNGPYSSSSTDSHSAISRERTNAMDVDNDTLQMPPPPPPTAASVSSATSPRPSLPSILTLTSPSSTSTGTPRSVPAPIRTQGRSSLFSLLNDQPVSPIHSSRYLAQIMNPAPPPSASSTVSANTVQSVSSIAERELEQAPTQVTEPIRESRPLSEPMEEQRVERFSRDLEVKKERFGDIDLLHTSARDFVNESREPEPIIESDSDFPGDECQRAPAPRESASPVPAEQSAAEEEEAAPSLRRAPSPTPSALSSLAEETKEIRISPKAEEVKEMTPSPASPSDQSASRESTPKPATMPVRIPSLSPVPLLEAEQTAVSSPFSPSPSISVVVPQETEAEADKGRWTSPASSAPGMPTHGVHDLASPTPASQPELESPAMLFKEELEEAAAALARSAAFVPNTVEKVEDAQVESEDESEVKMMVDHSADTERHRSTSSPMSSLSASERKSMSANVEHVDHESVHEKDKERMEVDDDVQIKADSDEEMHDVNETLASPEQDRVSLAPAVDVQQPSPSPEARVESFAHSPVVEKRLMTPEVDVHQEEERVLAAASVPPEPMHDTENVPAAIHPAVTNDAHLLASPNLLRAPSPTISVGSSAAIRPTPPPFAVPSDTEHEHETDHDRAEQSRASSHFQEKTPEVQTAATPTVPSEPQKIRRSMADYKQRKRKQREEEAARAAMMSPTSPTSSLQQDIVEATSAAVTEKENEQVVKAERLVKQNGNAEAKEPSQQRYEPVNVEPRPLSLLERIDRGDRANREALVGANSSLHVVPGSFTIEVNLPELHRGELSPKREMSEEHANLSPSPVVENKAWKFDFDSRSNRALSPPLSPGSVRSKGRASSLQAEEDGEILNAPPRASTPPSAPRADAVRAKAASESPSVPTPTSSTFANSRAARAPAVPPTQPRSFRDERRIPSVSPPPRHPRDSLPPPSSGTKSKLPGWASRERQPSAGSSTRDSFEKDKKMDNPPVRRASSYVPGPPPKSGAGSSSASGPSASASGLRGPPPSGPRALRGPPPSGPGRTQGPPVSRIPLSERVERDRARDFEREREKDRERFERDRERERERDYDRYSPPRGRYAGRGRTWGRGRR